MKSERKIKIWRIKERINFEERKTEIRRKKEKRKMKIWIKKNKRKKMIIRIKGSECENMKWKIKQLERV